MFSPNRCPRNLDEVVMLDLHTPTKLREAIPPQVLRSEDAIDAVEEWLKIVQRHLCEHPAVVATVSFVLCAHII